MPGARDAVSLTLAPMIRAPENLDKWCVANLQQLSEIESDSRQTCATFACRAGLLAGFQVTGKEHLMMRTVLLASAAAAIATPALARDGSPYVGPEGGILFPQH